MLPSNWPKLPKTLEGLAGPIAVLRPVHLPSEPGTVQLGEWDAETRIIKVKSTLKRDIAWHIFIHEGIHSAIDDAGLTMDADAEEAICNTVGSAMLRMIYDSFLR